MNSQDIQQMLMSIMQAQDPLTLTMSSLKEDVDCLKVTSTIPDQKTKESSQKNKTNQNIPKPKSNHKSGCRRAQTEPAALKNPPKKLPSLHPKYLTQSQINPFQMFERMPNHCLFDLGNHPSQRDEPVAEVNHWPDAFFCFLRRYSSHSRDHWDNLMFVSHIFCSCKAP
ncbi:hypothetical protein O181_111375 [Austropuccinia psidii MF-1]|uniref:Uncharacterized protein n=1 Tax=Austropuccinia psidii MF-1 TaxID=1389203 RepID=A0A9Q3K2A0_9BASI|nr:hypothetical protein [Austropuccinia psidii MF-1]